MLPFAIRPGRATLAAVVIALTLCAGCGVKINDGGLAGPIATSTSTGQPKDPTPTTSTTDRSSTTIGTSRTTSTSRSQDTTTTSSTDGPPSTLDPNLRDGLVQGFVAAGLTQGQATCMADGYESLGLSDPGSASDLDFSKVTDLFDQCGVSPSQLGAGTVPGGN